MAATVDNFIDIDILLDPGNLFLSTRINKVACWLSDIDKDNFTSAMLDILVAILVAILVIILVYMNNNGSYLKSDSLFRNLDPENLLLDTKIKKITCLVMEIWQF